MSAFPKSQTKANQSHPRFTRITPKLTELDQKMMRRALKLARKGEGRVEPNPMVGCVIVHNGRVIGEGYHRRFGGPHAEIEALRACKRNPRGATVYVSLEPCCHHGKTPPCTDALIDAGVARVVVPLRDPNPDVYGKGLRRLRAAGIEVTTGVLRSGAKEVLAPFLTLLRKGRPYVIAKWAQSLDGLLVTPPGESKWISCEKSRRTVHRLRARVDAILVGIGTVLADDPRLTARGVPLRRKALRVVLDGGLRVPVKSNLVTSARKTPTLIFTTSHAVQSKKGKQLMRKGVELIRCRTKSGRLSLSDCLSRLADRGVANLLVEGGPTILDAMFKSRVVDEAWVFEALDAFTGRSRRNPLLETVDARGFHIVGVRFSGDDIFWRLQRTVPSYVVDRPT